MYRRITSSCVLAGFIIAQWAAIPHAHAQGSSLDHDSTPHIHLDAGGSSHSHSHSHKQKHGYRTKAAHDHCHATPTARHTASMRNCGVGSVPDHDSDAVYLPSPTPITTTSGVDHSKSIPTSIVLHTYDNSIFSNTYTENLVASLHPSHDYAPSCALYLALRTLRI